MSKRRNKSLYYILPLIKGWSANADLPLNSYVKGHTDGCLVLEYFSADKSQAGDLVVENPQRKFVSCEIDPKFADDYQLLINGQYSKISDASKNLIISRAPSFEANMRVENVLYKSKKLKRQLESDLGIRDIDSLTDEYESIMRGEEIFNKEKHEV